MVLITNNQATNVLQPSEQPFNFVTSAVSSQRTPVLCRGLSSVVSMGCNHFKSGRRRFLVQRVAVIRFVSDQSFRELVDQAFEESVCDKWYFMRRSRRYVTGERKSRAVYHRHELCTLAPLGLSHSEPLFLVTANPPPIKHSLRLISPRARRPSASASSTFRKAPSQTNCLNRLWQVWQDHTIISIDGIEHLYSTNYYRDHSTARTRRNDETYYHQAGLPAVMLSSEQEKVSSWTLNPSSVPPTPRNMTVSEMPPNGSIKACTIVIRIQLR